MKYIKLKSKCIFVYVCEENIYRHGRVTYIIADFNKFIYQPELQVKMRDIWGMHL